MGFLKWLEDAANNVGRGIGTAADVVIPGDQSNWHQPDKKVSPPQPASTARPQVNQVKPMASYPNFTKPNPIAPSQVRPIEVPKINMPLETAKQAVGGIVSDIKNSVTNVPVHLALQGADMFNAATGHSDPTTRATYQASNPITKAVFGSQPIKSYQGQAEDASRQLEDLGINPTLASAASVPISGLLAGMDLSQFKIAKEAAPVAAKVTTGLVKPVVEDAKAGFPKTLASEAGHINPDIPVNPPKPLGEQVGRLKAAISNEPDPNVKSELATQLQTLNRGYAASKSELNVPPAAKTPTELPSRGVKHVSTLDKITRSTRSIIERQGEHGQQLAGMLQAARDKAELHLAELQKAMPTVHSLRGKDFENFVEATQGQAEANSPKIAQAVSEWQAVHPKIREAAVKAGLDVGDLGPKYYPHFIDYDAVFKNRDTYNEALNHLVKTGQAKSHEEAIQLLGYARDVSRNRQFGNLESSRLVDIPMYDKTPNSLVSYLSGSTHRIAQTNTFGAKDENALKLIAKAGGQGYDTEAMKNAYDVAVGAKQYNPNTQNFSNKVRAYNSTTRLGLGAITNSSQNVNTGIVTGHLRTLGAMVKQLDKKTQSYVADTGVISDAVLNDIKSQAGFIGKSLSKITAPGFNAVEKFNRSVAATSGRDYALRLAQKGDEKTLRRLGVTGEINGKTLTHEQQIQASRKVVEKTQFKVDPQDLPGWVDSPGGKLVAQFRTFSYNQSKFFSNEILKPAAKGDLQPLARLLAALPVGYALYETKRAIAGRPEEENQGRKGLEAFGNIGGAGLAVDLFRGLVPLNGKYLSPDRFTSMAAGTIGGPAVGNLVDFAGGASQAVQKKNLPKDGDLSGKLAIPAGDGYYDETQLARFGLRQLPIVGTPIQNRVLPYKPASGTKTAQTPAQQAMEKDAAQLEAATAIADANGTRGKAPKTGSKILDASSKRVETTTQKLPTGISKDSADTLKRYARLNDEGKAKFSAEPANKLKLHKAQYEQNKLNGKLNGPEDLKAQQALSKEEVTSQFSDEVRDFYGLSKAQKNEYFKRDPDKAKELYAKAKEMDAKLGGDGKKLSLSTKSKKTGKGKKAKKGAFDYAKTVASTNTSAFKNQSALRNLVKAARITRKRITK